MKKGRNLKVGLAFSALAHLALLLTIPYLVPSEAEARAKSLQVWLEPKKTLAPKNKDRQVVSIVPVFKTTAPHDAKYRAEFAQKVDVEEKAPTATEIQKKPPNRPEKGVAKEQLNGLGLKKDPGDPLGLKPTFNDEAFAINANDDYLPDVKEGKANKLNTLQWQHAPFFNRMREKIKSIWQPQSQINRYDPEGELLGTNNRVTIVSITMDQRGELVELFVKDPSGVSYLDEEALRSFREAAPFSYPPKELFDEGGTFSFTFAFHLQLNRGFSLNFE